MEPCVVDELYVQQAASGPNPNTQVRTSIDMISVKNIPVIRSYTQFLGYTIGSVLTLYLNYDFFLENMRRESI